MNYNDKADDVSRPIKNTMLSFSSTGTISTTAVIKIANSNDMSEAANASRRVKNAVPIFAKNKVNSITTVVENANMNDIDEADGEVLQVNTRVSVFSKTGTSSTATVVENANMDDMNEADGEVESVKKTVPVFSRTKFSQMALFNDDIEPLTPRVRNGRPVTRASRLDGTTRGTQADGEDDEPFSDCSDWGDDASLFAPERDQEARVTGRIMPPPVGGTLGSGRFGLVVTKRSIRPKNVECQKITKAAQTAFNIKSQPIKQIENLRTRSDTAQIRTENDIEHVMGNELRDIDQNGACLDDSISRPNPDIQAAAIKPATVPPKKKTRVRKPRPLPPKLPPRGLLNIPASPTHGSKRPYSPPPPLTSNHHDSNKTDKYPASASTPVERSILRSLRNNPFTHVAAPSGFNMFAMNFVAKSPLPSNTSLPAAVVGAGVVGPPKRCRRRIRACKSKTILELAGSGMLG